MKVMRYRAISEGNSPTGCRTEPGLPGPRKLARTALLARPRPRRAHNFRMVRCSSETGKSWRPPLLFNCAMVRNGLDSDLSHTHPDPPSGGQSCRLYPELASEPMKSVRS